MTTNTPDNTPLAKVLDFPIQAGDVIDQEAVVIDRPAQGAPVDPPDEPARSRQPRLPIVPKWLSSRQDVVNTLRWTLNQAGYTLAFHGLRLPKYAGKTALYAPVGALRTLGRLLRWATAEDGNY